MNFCIPLVLALQKKKKKELIKEVTETEIWAAFSQINNLKAPGPDGLQASFYQKYWKIYL